MGGEGRVQLGVVLLHGSLAILWESEIAPGFAFLSNSEEKLKEACPHYLCLTADRPLDNQ